MPTVTLSPDMLDAAVLTQLATVTDTDALTIAPGVHKPAAAPVAFPPNVPTFGRGATLRCGVGGRYEIPDLSDIFDGVTFDGCGKAPVVLKVGTGAGGLGGKAAMLHVTVRSGAAGKQEIAQFHNLQNSVLRDFRVHDNAQANGLLFDNGCKNIVIGALWATNCVEHAVRMTTTAGTQRTRGIFIRGGLHEACGLAAYVLEDVEEVVIDQVTCNTPWAVLMRPSTSARTGKVEYPKDIRIGSIFGHNGGIRALYSGATYLDLITGKTVAVPLLGS